MTLTPYTPAGKTAPYRGGFYDMGTGAYCLVSVVGPTPDPNNADALIYYVMAEQVDSAGDAVTDASGRIVQTEALPKTVSKSGVGAKQHTMFPGWVQYIPAPNTTIAPDNLPATDANGNALTWTSGTADPSATGTVGDCYCATATPSYWRWSEGQYRAMHEAMAKQLQAVIDANSGTSGF